MQNPFVIVTSDLIGSLLCPPIQNSPENEAVDCRLPISTLICIETRRTMHLRLLVRIRKCIPLRSVTLESIHRLRTISLSSPSREKLKTYHLLSIDGCPTNTRQRMKCRPSALRTCLEPSKSCQERHQQKHYAKTDE